MSKIQNTKIRKNNYHVKSSGLNNYFRLIKYITLISFFYLFDHVNIFVVYVLLFWLFFGSYADFCTSQISVTVRFSSFRCSVFFMVQFVRIWKMIFRVILCDTLYTLFDTLAFLHDDAPMMGNELDWLHYILGASFC